MKRLIKKYPNRRLYDTVESRYITLADIRDLVMNGSTVTVIDKQSGKDISRSIFLQVISDQEQHGEPILSEALLAQVIRAHGLSAPVCESKASLWARWTAPFGISKVSLCH